MFGGWLQLLVIILGLPAQIPLRIAIISLFASLIEAFRIDTVPCRGSRRHRPPGSLIGGHIARATV